ncbi:MAG: ComEC/Rec2 family competence protein [Candidatus Aphodosoma sp.]
MPTTIQMLKADIGDAFIIKVKEGEESFTMVVDGGPRRAMRTVVPAIEALERIDMMVLTHYDSDHIGGILEYLTIKKEKAKTINKYWINCPHIHVRMDSKSSASEMATLKTFFEQLEAEGAEVDWREEVLQGMTYTSPNGLVRLEVITPTQESRKLNEEAYDKDMEKRKISTARVLKDFETPLQDLAKMKTPSSRQVVNNASISFIMETPHCRMLMLGDVQSGDVYKYLTALRDGEKYSKEHKLKVDYVKVPHHGSRYNLTSELLDIIDCDNYLISTCGGEEVAEGKDSKYNHPDRMTIAKILLHEGRNKGNKINLYFNYNNGDFVDRKTYLLHQEEIEDTNLNFEPKWDTPQI